MASKKKQKKEGGGVLIKIKPSLKKYLINHKLVEEETLSSVILRLIKKNKGRKA